MLYTLMVVILFIPIYVIAIIAGLLLIVVQLLVKSIKELMFHVKHRKDD